MSLLRWTKEYEVGHDQIDNEHRGLFDCINRFHDAWSEKQDRRELSLMLSQLIQYAEQHFHNEEELMRKAGYPSEEEHARRHEELVETIFDLAQKLENRAFNPTHETMAFLRAWLSEHILHEDMLFKEFLASQRQA